MNDFAGKVLIADAMSPLAAQVLADRGIQADVRTDLGPDGLLAAIPEYDAVIVRSASTITADVIAAGVRLKAIGRAGIGVDNIDQSAATERGILVMNTPFGNSDSAAEHAIALMMAMMRQVPQATATLRAGRWDKNSFKGREVKGKTLGVVGFGNIGQIVAQLGAGLRMVPLAYDPFMTAEQVASKGARKVELDELFATADVITCHTPLTAETRHIVGEAAFAKMKKGVFVINASRGGVVDETALVAALDSGKVAGAALDVFEQEPPVVDHPLRSHPKVILTPHLGASTSEASVRVAEQIAEQVADVLLGGQAINVVNAKALAARL